MPGFMYIPRQQNPQQAQMFNMLSNLMFQKMAHKQRMELYDRQLAGDQAIATQRIEAEKLKMDQQKISAEQKEIRGFQKEGWRESEAQKPVVEIGDTGLIPPQKGFEIKQLDVNGESASIPVETITPYGEDPQISKVGTIKTAQKAEEWKTLPLTKIGDDLVIPQFNTKTKKVEYTKFGKVAPDGKKEVDPIKALNVTSGVRKEFTQQSRTFVEVRDAYNRIQASGTEPSAAGDLALIFNFMKVLDPGSTVREGEFATAETSGSVPQRIWAKYNKVLQGERLAPEQRQDFLKRSEMLYKKQVDSHKQLKKEYSRIAKSYGIDPDLVVVDYSNQFSPTDKQDLVSAHKKEDLETLYKKYPFLRGQ